MICTRSVHSSMAMHSLLMFAALVSVAHTAPQPQLINLDAIALDFPPPELVKAPIDVQSDIPATSTPAAITALQSVSAKKRDLVEKRDGDCSPYPAGSGPVPSPDTPSAFQSDPDFSAMAKNATTPDGYALVFNNLGASLQASNYMGLYTLSSYDTLTCASKCDQASGCSAFNVYLERDPTVDANAQNCPNPPSTTNYRCTLWGAPVSSEEATNSGQYRDSFQVVIAGSNGYNKIAPPASVNCYSGPQELGGAINAPPSYGSYMGYQYFPFSQSQGYNPQTCADACDAQTSYDSRHPAADGSFMSCVFFNAYVLSKNGIPQGLYCSMYNQTWDRSYGTNYGQYRGSDRYTVSESYSYTKTCNTTTTGSASSSKSVSSATASIAASLNSSLISSSTASLASGSSTVSAISFFGSSTTSPSVSAPTTTTASVGTSILSLSTSAASTTTVSVGASTWSSSASSFITTTASAGPSTISSSTSVGASTMSSSASAAITTTASMGASTTSPSTSSSASGYVPNPSCDPNPKNLVQNPGFECGLAPWDTYSSFLAELDIVQPGDASNNSFQYTGNGVYYKGGPPPPSLSQTIALTVGQAYTLTFRSWYPYCGEQGTIEVFMNSDSIYTVDDCEAGDGVYRTNTVSYTAKTSQTGLYFQFEHYAYGYYTNTMRIDNVALVAAPAQSSTSSATSSAPTASASAACNTSAPALQNPGFESGSLSPWVGTSTVGQSYFGVGSPGSALMGGGQYSASANLQTPNSPYGDGLVSGSLSQPLNLCAGTKYFVTADYEFQYVFSGTCTLSIGISPYVTLADLQQFPPGWNRVNATFTADSRPASVYYAMSCHTPGAFGIDNVNITAL